MKRIYKDGTYLMKNPTWHLEDSEWKADEIIQLIQRNSLNLLKICEIGCGAGRIIYNLSERLKGRKEFFGYEISPQAYELCINLSRDNLTFFLQDLLEEQDVQFDVVMAIDVFEHVEDYYGFLRKLKSKSKYKIFRIPLDLSVQSVLRASPLIEVRRSVGHIHYFTKETAFATLTDSGYDIVDYFYSVKRENQISQKHRVNLVKPLRKLAFSLNQELTARVLGGYSLLVLAK